MKPCGQGFRAPCPLDAASECPLPRGTGPWPLARGQGIEDSGRHHFTTRGLVALCVRTVWWNTLAATMLVRQGATFPPRERGPGVHGEHRPFLCRHLTHRPQHPRPAGRVSRSSRSLPTGELAVIGSAAVTAAATDARARVVMPAAMEAEAQRHGASLNAVLRSARAARGSGARWRATCAAARRSAAAANRPNGLWTAGSRGEKVIAPGSGWVGAI